MIRNRRRFFGGVVLGGRPIYIPFLIAVIIEVAGSSDFAAVIGDMSLSFGFAYTVGALVISLVLFIQKKLSVAAGILAGIPVGLMAGFATCETIVGCIG